MPGFFAQHQVVRSCKKLYVLPLSPSVLIGNRVTVRLRVNAARELMVLFEFCELCLYFFDSLMVCCFYFYE